MARIVLAEGITEDFERILDHPEAHESTAGPKRVTVIVKATDVLASSPLIGRPARQGNRELVIGRGPAGYVALYRFDAAADLILVLAIRSQKEAGFAQGG
jgi:plasmid stabilization system protein ParE